MILLFASLFVAMAICMAAGGALLLISVAAAAHNPAPGPTPLDALGGAILLVAILGEGLADAQLRAFARDPANTGKVCDVGLWGWSRHPNYFFEWLGWTAYPVIALDLAGPYPWAVAALIAPVTMYVILRFVTGVPPLEQHMLASRGEAFRAYQARVSIFLPLPRAVPPSITRAKSHEPARHRNRPRRTGAVA
jgi:steroid 5-alpha reductase family enzyme